MPVSSWSSVPDSKSSIPSIVSEAKHAKGRKGTDNTLMKINEQKDALEPMQSERENRTQRLSVLSSSSCSSLFESNFIDNAHEESEVTFKKVASDGTIGNSERSNNHKTEKLEDEIEYILADVRETINELRVGPLKGSDGNYNDVFQSCVSDLSSSTMLMSHRIWTENEKFLQRMSGELLSSNTLSLICAVLVDMLKNESIDEDGNFQYLYEIRSATSLITNCSCASIDFADAVADEPGFLKMVADRFTEWQHWHTAEHLEVR